MQIVVLEQESMGYDIDITCFEDFGEVTYYKNTAKDEVAQRVKDVDIIIANKAPIPNQKTRNPTVAISITRQIPATINQNCHIKVPPIVLE